ncbi:MAG TPA: heme NO-binding protein [candidate division WOR-3 bacterium]|uniref:Heme NO-binding protein n=1 Tax=candidate division WOR-3 bacterium TaxID=2052148 RepID=A0A9C9JZN2_UNCW3|nr:heme NO-binding protein [candidate division WOR-3 bacterium]
MKGIINKGIQEMVESMYGTDAWNTVKEKAGCNEPFFAISLDYPDEMTIALIKAAAEVSGRDEETVMVEYGKFMVPNTLKKYYPTYFKLAGSTAREFLLNMGKVHEQATRSITNAKPPHFDYEETSDGKLRMCYHSKRNLCAVLRGLILGVGILFNEKLKVQEIACVHKGDPNCIMEVTFS